MADTLTEPLESLSSWWRVAALATMAGGFAVLILLTVKAYQNAPPIPDKFVNTAGAVVFTARSGLCAGGKWIRTIGPPPEIVVDPSGSRRDHRAKYGCLSARPRVRCLCPPGKTQHLLPKSVFVRPGSDRWTLASTTFADAGPIDALGRAE